MIHITLLGYQITTSTFIHKHYHFCDSFRWYGHKQRFKSLNHEKNLQEKYIMRMMINIRP